MNGKYVGSRPIKLRKSNWEARGADIQQPEVQKEVVKELIKKKKKQKVA
jgi:hypothetical protein